jgi:hypothetical protein
MNDRFQYKMIWVPNYLADSELENPDREKLRNGSYEPPVGWRIVSFDFASPITGRNGGISFLLESPVAPAHPYR